VGIPRVFFVGKLIQHQEDKNFLEQELGERPITFFPDSKAIRRAERNEQPLTTLTEGLDEAPRQLADQLLSGK